MFKQDLPVRQLRFGDTGAPGDEKRGIYRVGSLICEGDGKWKVIRGRDAGRRVTDEDGDGEKYSLHGTSLREVSESGRGMGKASGWREVKGRLGRERRDGDGRSLWLGWGRKIGKGAVKLEKCGRLERKG